MSNYTILLQMQANLAAPDAIEPDILEAAAQQALIHQNVSGDAMVSIIIGTDEYLRDLNQQFRGIDAPTDVLSFPAAPLPPEVEDVDSGYLGDIAIALPYTARRATQEGHAVIDEVRLLIVHGILHLLGFEHDTPQSQQQMWKVQAEILRALNIALVVPDYIHEN